jgi:hypothetical protein
MSSMPFSWNGMSHGGDGIESCGIKPDTDSRSMRRASKIVLIALRRDRGDNHLRGRNIRNSISLTMP